MVPFNGVPGVGVEAFELMLSIEPRLLIFVRRFNVPLLLHSSIRLRLGLLVNVPPRSGEVGLESVNRAESPASFTNCLVIDVNGRFGFIDGFRFIVPVGNSVSNPLLSSDKQPLELELEARDSRPLIAGIMLFPLLSPLLLLHCDGTADTMLPIEPLLADDNLSSSSRARSSNSDRWLSSSLFPY
jgi:hypothetical protein